MTNRCTICECDACRREKVLLAIWRWATSAGVVAVIVERLLR